MPRDVALQDAPTVVCDDEEAIVHTEGERGYGEKVHRRDCFAVILKKPRPTLCGFGIARRFACPAKDGSVGDIEAAQLKLTVNARRAPGRILSYHAKDQLVQLPACGPSSHAMVFARNPSPAHSEPDPMPAWECLGLHKDRHVFQSVQNRLRMTQKNCSGALKLGLGCRYAGTASCW